MNVEKYIVQNRKKGKPLLAVLVDPDKFNPEVVIQANSIAGLFLVGGSVLKPGQLKTCIAKMKKITSQPIVIFPGDNDQLDKRADAMLLLSLVSGNNPEYIIGKHVASAKKIKALKQEIIPTAYIMIDGERISATQKVTATQPIKSGDFNKIVSTAIAAELLGFRMIYLEAGSGAKTSIKTDTISKVKKHVAIPLLVGGGIDTEQKAIKAIKAGADVIVIGNALEKNISLLNDLKKLF